jgi:hypothetical protein
VTLQVKEVTHGKILHANITNPIWQHYINNPILRQSRKEFGRQGMHRLHKLFWEGHLKS